jgi:hypothetical protein
VASAWGFYIKKYVKGSDVECQIEMEQVQKVRVQKQVVGLVIAMMMENLQIHQHEVVDWG